MWKSEALALSLTCAVEMGAVIHKDGYLDRFVIGGVKDVVIDFNDVLHSGTFHTHLPPSDGFSVPDIVVFMKLKEEIMAIGIEGFVGYFKRSWLPKKLRHRVDNYNRLSSGNKRLLSIEMDDYVSKHTRWIE